MFGSEPLSGNGHTWPEIAQHNTTCSWTFNIQLLHLLQSKSACISGHRIQAQTSEAEARHECPLANPAAVAAKRFALPVLGRHAKPWCLNLMFKAQKLHAESVFKAAHCCRKAHNLHVPRIGICRVHQVRHLRSCISF